MARYWTGGRSNPAAIREIALNGCVIDSTDIYYPGTLIWFTLEDTVAPQEAGESISYIGVWGKVLRTVNDGFCVVFVFEKPADRREFRRFLLQVWRRSNDETGQDKTEKTSGASGS